MVVLLYAVEVEILDGLASPGRDELVAEAAKAYRARSAVRAKAGQVAAADADRKRAAKLEADARQLAAKEPTAEAEKLTREIAELRKRLDEARVKLGTPVPVEREAGSSPAAAGTGRLRLINAWMEPMTVVVDGVEHPLRSGEAKTVTRPAGDFTYEVRGVRAPAKRTLRADDTYTIRIGPP